MSKMRDLLIDIQVDVEAGKLTFAQIADKYNVPYKWVVDVYMMVTQAEHGI